MPNEFVCIGVANNCKNPEGYGTICVKCNLCGRFDMNEREWDKVLEAQQVREELGKMNNIPRWVHCEKCTQQMCFECAVKHPESPYLGFIDKERVRADKLQTDNTRLIDELNKWIAIGDNYEARELDAKDENARLTELVQVQREYIKLLDKGVSKLIDASMEQLRKTEEEGVELRKKIRGLEGV